MILNILKLEFFLVSLKDIITCRYKLEDIITKICRKISIYHILNRFWQLLVQYHLLAHHLHRLLKYVDCSWHCFCQHKLLGFVNQRVFKMFMIISSTWFKVSIKFDSLSLKPMQDSRVVHLNVLAPQWPTIPIPRDNLWNQIFFLKCGWNWGTFFVGVSFV